MKLKIRINELARELEVKPNKILELLPELGVQEKKTHSSSIDEDVAVAIKKHFGYSEADGPRRPRESDEDDETPDQVADSSDADADADEQEHEPEPAAPRVQADAGHQQPKSEPAAPAAQASEPPAPAAEQQTTPNRFRAPLRPPVGRPIRPPVGVQQQPSPPPPVTPAPAAPPPPSAPAAQTTPSSAGPPSGVETPGPGAPGPGTPAPPRPRPAPSAPAPSATPSQPGMPQQPAPRPAGPGTPQPRVIPARDVPIYRPGQVVSGPRQPMPPDTRRPESRTMPIAPGTPRPPSPVPGAPRPPQQRPAGPGAPANRPSQGGPQQQAGPGAPSRPTLIGRPAARPVVPPNQEILDRIRQTRPSPGAPAQPRPGIPQAPRPGSPVPGQPIYGRGPGGGRPGQPPRPGGPGGRRPMHPTTPLRPETAVPAVTDTQRRPPANRGRVSPEQRKREAEGKLRSPEPRVKAQPLPVVNKEITIGEGITVKELAEKLGVKSSLVIKQLVDRKIFATINQTLDVKLAEELARQFGATTSTLSFEEEATWEVELAEKEVDIELRAPVVTVMGHVDHGKTSLLDAIRSTNVADREAGGITQHIGASVVDFNGQRIVFIDTPGHEAFTRMRARGAKVTDIVILVVSADDGVMPQTVEAIDHARAAKVPIVVAINKIDKPGAQPERIKQQLADRGLLAEDWGGDVIMVPVSARDHTNIDLLLENVLLVAELGNFRANPTRPAIGTVLEAQLDRGRGPVATVVVQNGTLKIGDFFICGQVFGKVRAMYDHVGNQVREAGPSMPVEVIGLDALPDVGDQFQVVTDTAKAKQIVMYREAKAREQAMAKGSRVTLEQLNLQAKEGDVKDLNLIIKTDVGGTAEVLSEMLQKLSTDKVRIRVISKNVGAITESDVLLASASNAIIIGFNVRPERNAAALAEKEKIDIRLHTIIYELTDEIKKAMTGMLEPVFKEVFRGRCDVREVFHISRVGYVAGCYVTDGTLTRDSQVRVLRDNIVIHTGRIESLRRFKNDVAEVKSGFECGVVVANFNDIKQGDVLEAFAMERVAAELGV